MYIIYMRLFSAWAKQNQQELLDRFKYEITEKLGTTAFHICTITEDSPQHVSHYTQLLLHDAGEEKIMLEIRHALQKEELLWLELLALYVSMFINNLQQIEDLVQEIQHMKTPVIHRFLGSINCYGILLRKKRVF